MRSRAGSQILTSAGFTKVLNMSGGISAWKGHQAVGPEELGLDFFISGDFPSALSMAYAMEEGLRRFYRVLADRAENSKTQDLLTYMARFEDAHMAKLAGRHPGLQPPEEPSGGIAEGGIPVDEFLSLHGDGLKDVEVIIQTGMRFEAQAYDMYKRLADREQQPELHDFYLQMATEEQAHLRQLAEELEKRLA